MFKRKFPGHRQPLRGQRTVENRGLNFSERRRALHELRELGPRRLGPRLAQGPAQQQQWDGRLQAQG